MTPELDTTLLGHLPPYHHAALALHEQGWLGCYLTVPYSVRPLPGAHTPAIGPGIRHWNRTRVLPELAAVPATRLWGAQLAAYAAQRVLDRRSLGHSLATRSAIWDLAAWPRVGRPDVFHFVHGLGLRSGTRARERGAYLVCDVRAPHRSSQLEATVPALARQGLEYRMITESISDRLDRELRLADLLVCSSEYSRRTYVERGFDEARVVSVPLGYEAELFAPASEPVEPFTVLFVGRERTRKGLIDLADAARALRADSRIVLTGHPDAETLGWFEGSTASIEFTGEVPLVSMPDLYRRASVLVLPSYSEAFGMVVVEAMASGLPVVVTDHTGAAEAVTDGVSGYVVPAGDSDALADRLVTLERDRDLARRMGSAAAEAAPCFSWSAYRGRLVQVYRDVVVPAVS